MKVTVVHQKDMKFEAKTHNGSFIIDCPVISPIEYFLSGLIACSASDMIALPKNQGHKVDNLVVEGDVVRAEDHPRKFVQLHLKYSFDSDGDDTKAARWVMASVETYCSTINTIRDTTAISYTIVHNGTTIRENEKMISGSGSTIDLGEIDACCS
jgi:putative redox protein